MILSEHFILFLLTNSSKRSDGDSGDCDQNNNKFTIL